jgi:adenylate cyclase
MGDCIMAFWNAPVDVPDHATQACRAALAMLKALDQLNDELASEAASAGRSPDNLKIGIGMNTGAALVGNLGSEQRFDYSILGDSVNLASRLEGQSKAYWCERADQRGNIHNGTEDGCIGIRFGAGSR